MGSVVWQGVILLVKKQVTVFGAFLILTLAQRPALAGTVMYDSLPAPLPDNVVSLGYQANQVAEFGDLIQFAPGTARSLWDVKAVMSDWALASTYDSTDPGWSYPITLNLYNVDSSSGTPQLGALIVSVTQTFLIPWRPEASAVCGEGGGWLGSDNACHGGLAFEVIFNLNNITVPDQLIYGIAFNTNTWGYDPVGTKGPYESLNVGLTTSDPSVGSNPLAGSAYINAGQGGTFGQDTFAYSGTVEFESVPEPGTVGLMLGGLLLLAGAMGRKKR
jgi:hypothetical protein